MNVTQEVDDATKKVLNRLLNEPGYSTVLFKILAYCDSARSFSDVESKILSFPEMKGALQSPKILLKWLVEAGGIEQIALQEEEPIWHTTVAGQNVVEQEAFHNRLRRLFDQELKYQDIYLKVLQACMLPKSRAEIEAMLDGNPALESPIVYPSFFLETLERSGALEWNDKWQITQTGESLLKGGA